ncbi:MAG: type II toxin-antitoxin system Phd/YefM family antitoxin [Solirubrobacterales bacterium]
MTGSQKVGGSNPPGSTSSSEPTGTTVGANQFRNHFGYYMERAAAGEVIAVSRRGKGYVRLLPHQPQLVPSE